MSARSRGTLFVAIVAFALSLGSGAALGQLKSATQKRIYETWWPAASNGYRAYEIYPVARAVLWAATLHALSTSGIPVETVDLSSGTIVTAFAYPDGKKSSLSASQARRFSYRVQLVEIDASNTKVLLTPRIETTYQAGSYNPSYAPQWSDVTGDAIYAPVVDVLNDWLGEQIDRALT